MLGDSVSEGVRTGLTHSHAQVRRPAHVRDRTLERSIQRVRLLLGQGEEQPRAKHHENDGERRGVPQRQPQAEFHERVRHRPNRYPAPRNV